jgi:hypothetical protein
MPDEEKKKPAVVFWLKVAGVLTIILGCIEAVDAWRNTDQFWPFAAAIWFIGASTVFFALAAIIAILSQR